MRKIFYIIFLFFLYFTSTFADENIKIISRSEWWADENIRFSDSPEWIKIIKQWEEQAIVRKNTVYTQAQIDAQDLANKKAKLIDEILVNNFSEEFKISEKITSENGRKLLWSIQIAKNIKGIVIHHTSTNYSTSLESIKKIYRYHTLDKQWWDIWYNYLIWNDWEIFEWRAWWDNAVAAHDKYNNTWDIWIAFIWNYSKNPINDKQYQALKSLTSYLVKKYQIDLTKKVYFHKECNWKECVEPIISQLQDPIIGHRDAWHTDCPGDELYKQIQDIKTDLLKESTLTKQISSVSNVYKSNQLKNNEYKSKIFKILAKMSDEKLINLLAKIEDDIEIKPNSSKSKLKDIIIEYFKEKKTTNNTISNINDSKISVKLSYPNTDTIEIKSWKVMINITRDWNNVNLNWKSINILKIPKNKTNWVLEISSWQRRPDWDIEWKYNDNKFRWELLVYVKDSKLVVVNKLDIEDYLKWLWEVSDSENPEKIKTIITAARSYATWYVTKAKKFPGELYDWADDPEVFQRYLWYWLEMRSPNINKIVEETKWQLITFNWDLIKPWYFSNSNWKTISYYDYCHLKYTDDVCIKEAKKYPYLQSVVDKWSQWKTTLWHWVWISGAWVKYFALKWWTYDMIIKYYLKWVEVL